MCVCVCVCVCESVSAGVCVCFSLPCVLAFVFHVAYPFGFRLKINFSIFIDFSANLLIFIMNSDLASLRLIIHTSFSQQQQQKCSGMTDKTEKRKSKT